MEASRAAPPPRARKSLRLLKRTADPAFERLYREHAREVYQYALALLTNPADAEDVTQTTFLNAYRAYQRGERPQKPHNWLIAITHNVCRMRWRQAGCRPSEVALDEAPEPAALDHERPNLDEVLTALAHLTFNQRSALVMRELEGRSYQEIAGVLDLSVSAVEALLFRARRRLKVERTALGVLTTVPLPGSLTSFLGAGGGAVAAGGTAIGADLVL
jgi:RNA polymerase sigma-70 factor (ECF subfamily)